MGDLNLIIGSALQGIKEGTDNYNAYQLKKVQMQQYERNITTQEETSKRKLREQKFNEILADKKFKLTEDKLALSKENAEFKKSPEGRMSNLMLSLKRVQDNESLDEATKEVLTNKILEQSGVDISKMTKDEILDLDLGEDKKDKKSIWSKIFGKKKKTSKSTVSKKKKTSKSDPLGIL